MLNLILVGIVFSVYFKRKDAAVVGASTALFLSIRAFDLNGRCNGIRIRKAAFVKYYAVR